MKHIYTLVVFLFAALTMNAQELISCAQAQSLMPEKPEAVTEQEYIVAGYVTKIERNPSPSHVNASIMQQWFYLDDQKGGAQTVNCYWCDLPNEYKEGLNIGDKVAVKGNITNNNNTPEIKNGVVAMLEREIVSFETYEVSVCEAIEAGLALPNNMTSEDRYAIHGYIDSIAVPYDSIHGNMSFFMTDNMSAPTYDFEAYRVRVAEDQRALMRVGAEVIVTAALKHYHLDPTDEKPAKDVAETLEGGTLVVFPPEGILSLNANPADSTRKIIENGQVVIIRNGIRYNTLGAVLR